MSDGFPQTGEGLSHLVYAFGWRPRLSRAELREMLQNAKTQNESLGVTGILLVADESFIEVLEGPKPVVDGLYEGIARDPHHTQLLKLFEGAVDKRHFEGWSAGIAPMEGVPAEELPGENDFFGVGSCLQRLDPSMTKQLLTEFKNGSWRMAAGDPEGDAGPSKKEESFDSRLMWKSRFVADHSDNSE